MRILIITFAKIGICINYFATSMKLYLIESSCDISSTKSDLYLLSDLTKNTDNVET